jgi:very-short-patch-repair endonuclease
LSFGIEGALLNTKSNDGSSPRRFRRYSAGVDQHLSQLRREMTPAEQLLWTWLRDRKLDGVKFRRQ